AVAAASADERDFVGGWTPRRVTVFGGTAGDGLFIGSDRTDVNVILANTAVGHERVTGAVAGPPEAGVIGMGRTHHHAVEEVLLTLGNDPQLLGIVAHKILQHNPAHTVLDHFEAQIN